MQSRSAFSESLRIILGGAYMIVASYKIALFCAGHPITFGPGTKFPYAAVGAEAFFIWLTVFFISAMFAVPPMVKYLRHAISRVPRF